MLSGFPREPHHLTHLDDDVGERHSALLFRCYSCSYREAKRIYERQEPFVVRRDEIVG